MSKTPVSDYFPPVVWRQLAPLARAVRRLGSPSRGLAGNAAKRNKGESQECEIYWDEDFAKVLETWGEGNAWKEIECLMADRKGRVLDIACGTGKVMEIISRFRELEIHGCDISDLLIDKARARGIAADRLKVCDATATGYEDKFFDYAYSIGSLEHFTENGIHELLMECRRIVKSTVFHQIPTARSGKNEGWIQPLQSYFNNNVDWWMTKFRLVYEDVEVIDSLWEDSISLGKWFVCKSHQA